jgi:mannose-6-phosphate isomerase-like protein (cupin superfamily)
MAVAVQVPTREGQHYRAADVGPWEMLGQYELDPPLRGRGKLFLREILGLTGMEVSLNRLGAGKSVTFRHRHREHEELYIFVKGRGQFQVDGEVFDVQEGTVVRVDPAGDRVWRNHSDEPLYFIVVQAMAGSLDAKRGEDGIPSEGPVVWPEA